MPSSEVARYRSLLECYLNVRPLRPRMSFVLIVIFSFLELNASAAWLNLDVCSIFCCLNDSRALILPCFTFYRWENDFAFWFRKEGLVFMLLLIGFKFRIPYALASLFQRIYWRATPLFVVAFCMLRVDWQWRLLSQDEPRSLFVLMLRIADYGLTFLRCGVIVSVALWWMF